MIIVAGTITFDSADIHRLREPAAAMMAATHLEAGCREYVFSESLAEPGTVQVFEVWDSPEALEAHFATEHMATYRAALADLTITSRELYTYEASNQQPLG